MRYFIALSAIVVFLASTTSARAEQALPDGWGYVALTSHWRVSAMLDGQVYSSDGRPVGWLHDLIFDHEGQLQQLIVEADARSGSRYFVLGWGETRFSAAVGSLTLTVPVADIEALQQYDTPDVGSDGLEASNLMGMMVDLADRESWAQVGDLMVAPTDLRLSAMVVESLGPGRLQYAVPPHWDGLDYDGHRLKLPYTIPTIEAQGRLSRNQPGR